MVCLILFFTVFFGRGIFPEQGEVATQTLRRVLRTNTDFKAAFLQVGRALSDGEPVLDTLGNMWVTVFAPGSAGNGIETSSDYKTSRLYAEEKEFLSSQPSTQTVLARRFNLPLSSDSENTAPAPEETAQVPATTEPAAAVATLSPDPQPVYTGPALPANATMEKLPLGLSKTTAPVMAVISSPYGYRVHPIDGEYKFHAGVDLAADYGTDIVAFADGTVDYIGESSEYGKYLQLRHADGVTSFYAHCSKLCVQQGQTVSLGEKVAEVGDTGYATGPHLHFELKLNGERLNPAYYITTLSS
jgi:murein DD-endopeptidase MepM/ murein hydrolase activator NlpD